MKILERLRQEYADAKTESVVHFGDVLQRWTLFDYLTFGFIILGGVAYGVMIFVLGGPRH